MHIWESCTNWSSTNDYSKQNYSWKATWGLWY